MNTLKIAAAILALSLVASAQATLPLVTGAASETFTVTQAALAPDATHYQLSPRGIALSVTGAQTAALRRTFASTFTPPPVSAVGVWVWVQDASKVSSVMTSISPKTGATWYRASSATTTPALQTGWNHLRYYAAMSSQAALQQIAAVQFSVTTTDSTTVTLGGIEVECPQKAQLILIADGTYDHEFIHSSYPSTSAGGLQLAGGYADAKMLHIPVVLAPNPAELGVAFDRPTWGDLAAVMQDGNGNEMNFHAIDGSPDYQKTAQQVVAEVQGVFASLMLHGYAPPKIRAAWSQNLAINAAAARPYLDGMATSTGHSGSPVQAWPPVNRWDIARFCIQGRSAADFDLAFTQLQATHGIMIAYMHGVDPTGGPNGVHITPEMWGYFLDKVKAGVDQGWLEAVTFNQLLARQ